MRAWRSPAHRMQWLLEAGAMKVGYARVSTDDQNLALQQDALKQAGCVVIFEDRGVSGASTSRPALNQVLASLKPGDTLLTWKLDRLGRSLSHLISIIGTLEHRGIAFHSLSEAIDTTTAGGRLLFHVMGALAEFERSLIGERTRAGIEAARRRGRTIGRPSKLSLEQVKAAFEMLATGKFGLAELARRLEVSPLTLSRALCRLT